jgi:hypothetical protein
MNRKIHLGGVFGTSILLALMVIGFPQELLAPHVDNQESAIPLVEALKQAVRRLPPNSRLYLAKI